MKPSTVLLILGSFLLALGAHSLYHQCRSKTLYSTELVPATVQRAFEKWRLDYSRAYPTPQEHIYRLKNFYANVLRVEAMKKMNLSFEVALNHLADLSREEFKNKYLTLKEPKERLEKPASVYLANKLASLKDVPEWIDWRTKGAINDVVAQGECGSCWAFVGIVAVEGAWKISGRNLEKFSEQQMVDCAGWTGAEGCSGGWMEHVYEYILKTGGVMRGSDYPYKAKVEDCKVDSSKLVGKLKDWMSIPQGDCKDMILALNIAPLATAIDATYTDFYKGGIFDYPNCSDSVNHAVSIVGYGTDWGNGKPYWLVRNTFGPKWGEDGYIRMDRTVQPSSGICGICKRASFAVAADN